MEIETVKHAPEPWHIEPHPHAPPNDIIDANGQRVAVVSEASNKSGLPTPNANLIAAAPDGYKAAKKVLEIMHSVEWVEPSAIRAKAELRRFIARVEGT